MTPDTEDADDECWSSGRCYNISSLSLSLLPHRYCHEWVGGAGRRTLLTNQIKDQCTSRTLYRPCRTCFYLPSAYTSVLPWLRTSIIFGGIIYIQFRWYQTTSWEARDWRRRGSGNHHNLACYHHRHHNHHQSTFMYGNKQYHLPMQTMPHLLLLDLPPLDLLPTGRLKPCNIVTEGHCTDQQLTTMMATITLGGKKLLTILW